MLVSAMGIMLGFLLLMLILFDFFMVHFARHTAAGAADAAALGAAAQVGAEAKKLVPLFLQPKVDAFWEQINEDVDDHMTAWGAAKGAELAAQIRADHPDWTDGQVAAEVNARLTPLAVQEAQSYQDSLLNSRVQNQWVRNALKGQGNAPIAAWLQEFSSAQERGCILRQGAEAAGVSSAATFYAQENHATDATVTTATTTTELQVQSSARTTMEFPIFGQRLGQRALEAESKASLSAFYGLSVNFEGSCDHIGP
jgi:hypothetical protein